MIEIIKELKVEVSKPNVFQAIVAKQYDMNTRFLKVTLVDGPDVICIPNSETIKVVINAERKDGQSKGFDGVVNDDGTVTVPLHSWMLELDGTVICDISVIDTEVDDNKKLTTTSFTLIVEKAAYGGGDITSDPQYDVLIQLYKDCEIAKSNADEALQKSNEANTKYDDCVEATQQAKIATQNANQAAENANAVRSEVEAGGFIESLKELNKGEKFSVWIGKNIEYNDLAEIEENTLYITADMDDFAPIDQAISDLNDEVQELNTEVLKSNIEILKDNMQLHLLAGEYVTEHSCESIDLKGYQYISALFVYEDLDIGPESLYIQREITAFARKVSASEYYFEFDSFGFCCEFLYNDNNKEIYLEKLTYSGNSEFESVNIISIKKITGLIK